LQCLEDYFLVFVPKTFLYDDDVQHAQIIFGKITECHNVNHDQVIQLLIISVLSQGASQTPK